MGTWNAASRPAWPSGALSFFVFEYTNNAFSISKIFAEIWRFCYILKFLTHWSPVAPSKMFKIATNQSILTGKLICFWPSSWFKFVFWRVALTFFLHDFSSTVYTALEHYKSQLIYMYFQIIRFSLDFDNDNDNDRNILQDSYYVVSKTFPGFSALGVQNCYF